MDQIESITFQVWDLVPPEYLEAIRNGTSKFAHTEIIVRNGDNEEREEFRPIASYVLNFPYRTWDRFDTNTFYYMGAHGNMRYRTLQDNPILRAPFTATLREYDHPQIAASLENQLHSTKSVLLFKITNRNHFDANLEDEPIPDINFGAKKPKLTNKFITYDTTLKTNNLSQLLGKETMNDYLTDNYKHDACLYTCIINTFYETFKNATRIKNDKTYKVVDFELTYENLWNMLHPNKEMDTTMFDTINNIIPFFKKYHLSLYCFDIKMNLIDEASYVPETRNKKLSPNSMYILLHNNHAYQITAHPNELTKYVNKEIIPQNQLEVTSSFNLNNYSSCYTYIENIEELNLIDFSKMKKNEVVFVYYNHSLTILLRDFIQKYNYEPFIHFNAGRITSLVIRKGEVFINIRDPGEIDSELPQTFSNQEYFTTYNTLDKALYERLLNKNTKSFYNPNFFQIMRKFTRGPLVQAFKNDIPKTYYMMDYNKAYTSNLLDMKFIPVFNIFDNFTPCTNDEKKKIRDYSFYYIRNIKDRDIPDTFIACNKECDVVTGYLLNRIPKLLEKVNILAVAHPHRLIENNCKSVIEEIYASNLDIKHKKFIVNKNIGLCGKFLNNKTTTHTYKDASEAMSHAKKYGGAINALVLEDINEKFDEFDNTNMLFILTQKKDSILEDGFLPIQHFIYDIMRLKMQEMYDDLKADNCDIIGIKTDSLYFTLPIEKKGKQTIFNKYEDLKAIKKDYNKFDTIGTTRVEQGKGCPTTYIPFNGYKEEGNTYFLEESEFIKTRLTLPIIPNIFDINDEYDDISFNNIFNNQDRIFITASVPGAGKSTALKKYADHIGKDKVIFICPYNPLAIEYKREGYKSATLHTLTGYTISEDGTEAKSTRKNYDLTGIEVMVFDEVRCFTTKDLQKMKHFMNTHELRYFSIGDKDQIRPIEQLNIENYKLYYHNIIMDMFPNMIDLKVCKRMSKEDGVILNKIKEDIFGGILTFTDIAAKYFKIINSLDEGTTHNNLVYLNATCDGLNNYYHSKSIPKNAKITEINGRKFYAGLDVMCKKYIKLSTTERLYVNYIYKITKINDTLVDLMDPFDEKTYIIPTKHLQNFSFTHAQTNHTAQGKTIKDRITIYDISKPFVTAEWLWVAVTRATSINDINVFMNTKVANVSKKQFVEDLGHKIYGHKTADRKANRPFSEEEYVTPEYILELLDQQDACCAKCQQPMDFSKYSDSLVSINRKDNKLAHIRGNCEIACVSCQRIYNH